MSVTGDGSPLYLIITYNSLSDESKNIPSAFLIGTVYVVDETLPPVLPYKSMLLEKGFLWLSFDIPASIKLLVVALGSNILQVDILVLLPALVPLFNIKPTATPSLVLS